MTSGTTTRPVALTLAITAAALVAVAALVVTAVVRAQPDDPPPTAPDRRPERSMPDVEVTEAVASLAVLRDWDAARAAAWAAGDPRALRRLYLPGSVAGERDVAMLQRWSGRGLAVRGMAMQVLAVRLLARSDRRVVLLVTDRLAGAVAVPRGGDADDRWPLPRDEVTTRRLEFRRTQGEWRLVAALGRPLVPTAVTGVAVRS